MNNKAEKEVVREKSGYSMFLRTISWIVIITFSWQQLAFAGAADIKERRQERALEKHGYKAIDFIKAIKNQQNQMMRRFFVEQARTKSTEKSRQDVAMHLEFGYFTQYKQVMALVQQIEKARDLISRASRTYILFPADVEGIQKRIDFFRGNAVAIWNERVEEGGEVYYRDTYGPNRGDMVYNDRGLLIEYYSTAKDKHGNISEVHWYDVHYAPGAKFYANEDTNAHKNILSYRTHERMYNQQTDTWQEVGNLTHARSDITYDENNNLESYTETITDEDGNLVSRIDVSESIYDLQSNELISYYQRVYDAENNLVQEGYVYCEIGTAPDQEEYNKIVVEDSVIRDENGNIQRSAKTPMASRASLYIPLTGLA